MADLDDAALAVDAVHRMGLGLLPALNDNARTAAPGVAP